MINPTPFTYDLIDDKGNVAIQVADYIRLNEEEVSVYDEQDNDITGVLTAEQHEELFNAYERFVREFESNLSHSERYELRIARERRRDKHGYLTYGQES